MQISLRTFFIASICACGLLTNQAKGENSCPFAVEKQIVNAAGNAVDQTLQSSKSGRMTDSLFTGTDMPWVFEKLGHFNREVIPERRMHAKGSGAFGKFTVTNDITNYTKASLFSEIGKETKVFVRFSTVAGERGAADAVRDIRGTAIKFYTEDGNWDLVGNNSPVFFLRNPRQFPDLNRVVKRDPRTNMHNATSQWDFWTQIPEALHQITITMSNQGIPRSYRNMNLHSSHTYSLINHSQERFFVKFHFTTMQGLDHLTDEEAAQIRATDPDSFQNDLYSNIEQENFPRWKMSVQIMPELEALEYEINPFDLTKIWPEQDYPWMPVGTLELNENPDNYFANVEQATFDPSAFPQGISFSPDPMLQARLFAYGDAARYRVGVNHHLVQVNKPLCPFSKTYHRDGSVRADTNGGSTPSYLPNSLGYLPNGGPSEPPFLVTSAVGDQWIDSDKDYYTQPGDLFRSMSKEEQYMLFKNTANNLKGVPSQIQDLHIYHCTQADPAYGKGVRFFVDIVNREN